MSSTFKIYGLCVCTTNMWKAFAPKAVWVILGMSPILCKLVSGGFTRALRLNVLVVPIELWLVTLLCLTFCTFVMNFGSEGIYLSWNHTAQRSCILNLEPWVHALTDFSSCSVWEIVFFGVGGDKELDIHIQMGYVESFVGCLECLHAYLKAEVL